MKILTIIIFGTLINLPVYAELKVNGSFKDECAFLKNKIEKTIYNADVNQKERDKDFVVDLKENNLKFYITTWESLCK